MRLGVASVMLLAPACQAYALCAGNTRSRRSAAAATAIRHPRMSGAWFVATTDLSADPYAIVGVERGASTAEIKRAYRARARELHPDTSCHNSSTDNSTYNSTDNSAERFRALVGAYQHLTRLEPGSAETHSFWDKLPDFYHHWARELGHHSAEGLEEWITVMTPHCIL